MSRNGYEQFPPQNATNARDWSSTSCRKPVFCQGHRWLKGSQIGVDMATNSQPLSFWGVWSGPVWFSGLFLHQSPLEVSVSQVPCCQATGDVHDEFDLFTWETKQAKAPLDNADITHQQYVVDAKYMAHHGTIPKSWFRYIYIYMCVHICTHKAFRELRHPLWKNCKAGSLPLTRRCDTMLDIATSLDILLGARCDEIVVCCVIMHHGWYVFDPPVTNSSWNN